MKNILLVDTDILIDAARKDHGAVHRLKIEEEQSILYISSITHMELIVLFLSGVHLLPVLYCSHFFQA